LRRGQGFGLRLRNIGTSAAYVNVLDLMPDGKIGPVWPIRYMSAEDTLVPSGTSYRIPDPNAPNRLLAFRACPPYGTDVLKVIATTEPVDFGPILGGGGARGTRLGPLDRLFQESLTGARGVSPAFSSGSVSTSAVTITIEPDD
jgi:hypothetical protein